MTVQSTLSRYQDIVQLAYFAIIIISLWMCEVFFTADLAPAKFKHTSVNLLFIFTALPIQLVMVSFVLMITVWTNLHHWGLIHYLPYSKNAWVYYISLFILMDLCEYVYHVIMHKLDFLWKFHLVHHSDLRVDVSTTIREHPGETFVRMAFQMLWVFLLGPVAAVIVLRQTVQTFSNIAAHTTFRLPARANKIIGLIFITPNLHQVHHHYQLPYTDRNYGDVLSVWDRLFGTYAELEKKDTVYGVDTHMEPLRNGRFFNILKIPFQKLVRK
ncbi:Sterol desaturase/sphingolipid hydroxylase, fatty acid hydroxylase superfamily [Mucilaginibacter pineti]|uniref:Sterol desaturase/sphingolipid hydroxylase, fatty acid hydroxylase superfamily n=1 Tax=Mucilaginibacter pineti TaxID=1391627 RepID=A0A1G7M187_9SPHI|nr:sterol desaturase family protein [Mucilaginibacter pineti]SDF55507.1 Sterol desaturase/sphingolipid hydroxylase, fatty acid hydroxylase superfamily [Mucilaginibacter pineti]